MGREAPDSWAHTVDRGLRLVLSVPLAVSVAADLPHPILLFGSAGLLPLCGFVFTAASIAVLLALILASGETPLRLWGAVILLALGQGCSLADALLYDRWPITWWPVGAAAVLVASLVVWTPPKRRIQVAAPAVILLGVCRFALVSLSEEPLVEAFVEGVLMVEIAAAAAIVADVLRNSARATDRALAERGAAKRQKLEATAHHDQLLEVEGFIHDEVIHALWVISKDRKRISGEAARQSAADAWAKLTPKGGPPRPAPRDLMTALEEMADKYPSGFHVDLSGTAPPLPPEVVEALTLAAYEAVRNVQKHAGTAHAYMEVAAMPGRGVSINVIDEGHGFDPSTARMRGSRSSILERVEAIGGSANIDSGPTGTRVTLTWEPGPPDAWVGADVSARLSMAAVPLLIGTIIVSFMLAPTAAIPWLALLGTVIATLVGLWAIRRIRVRSLTWANRSVLIAASLVSTVLNVIAVSPRDTRGHHPWLANGATALVLILVVSTSFAWGVAIVAMVCATWLEAALLHFGATPTLIDYSQVLIIPAAWLGVVVMQFTIDRLSSRAIDDWNKAIERQAHAHYYAGRAEIFEQRIARIRTEIGPFFFAVGNGVISPDDPKTQIDAAALESLVRDDAAFGGGPPAFRRQVTEMRRGGWEVAVRMNSNEVRGAGDLLVALVQNLPKDVPGGSLVLTATSTQLAAILTGLDPATTDSVASLSAALGWEAYSTPDFTELTIALSEKPTRDSPHTDPPEEIVELLVNNPGINTIPPLESLP